MRTQNIDIAKQSQKNVKLAKKEKDKKKNPSFSRNAQNYWQDWTESTSIHGLRYLGERRRNIIEKLWWLIAFAFALSCCTFWIISTYNRWVNSPVTVPTPIWQIPFPAVTICPENKIRQTVYNYTYFFHKAVANNLTDDELKDYQTTRLICTDRSKPRKKGPKYFDFADNNTIDFITKVAPTSRELLWNCLWADFFEECKQFFTPVLTEAGVCYTFNMLERADIFKEENYSYQADLKQGRDRNGWTLENGYSKDAGKDTYPRRALAAGASAGLVIYLRGQKQNFDYICNMGAQGFKILLHRPDETPRMNNQYFRIGFNQEVAVAVTPKMMTTSYGIKEFPISKRQCFFPQERALGFYRNYTQQNCEVECLTNYTLMRCDCVALYMPHDRSTKICGPGKIKCMKKAQHELLSIKLTRNTERETNQHLENNEDCNCLPDCTTLSYTAETSQDYLDFPAIVRAANATWTGAYISCITIFFKEMQFIASQRNELYSTEDFLANCGGILGLFIGFSFLSMAETIYFLTLRLWCNVRSYGMHFWAGAPEIVSNDDDDNMIHISVIT